MIGELFLAAASRHALALEELFQTTNDEEVNVRRCALSFILFIPWHY